VSKEVTPLQAVNTILCRILRKSCAEGAKEEKRTKVIDGRDTDDLEDQRDKESTHPKRRGIDSEPMVGYRNIKREKLVNTQQR